MSYWRNVARFFATEAIARKSMLPSPPYLGKELTRRRLESPLNRAPLESFKKDVLTNDFMWEPVNEDHQFIIDMVQLMKRGEVGWWTAEELLRRSGLKKMRPYHLCEILKNRVSEEAALKLFRWAKTQPRYSHDSHVYNILMKILGDNKNFKVMEELYEQMDKEKIRKNDITYMTLFQTYFDGDEIEKALKIFDVYERSEKPIGRHYKYVMHKLLKAGCYQVVPLIFKNMVWSGNAPDRFAYNVLISSLCKQGKVDEGLKYIKEMTDRGYRPDVFTYNHIMDGLGKTTNLEAAAAVFEDMVVNGCQPNINTFNVLLDTFCRAGKTLQAADLVRKMVSYGCPPDEKCFRILMEAFGKSGEVDASYNLIRDMISMKFYPNPFTLNTVMSRLSKVGKPEVALGLYYDLRKIGAYTRDIVTYNIVLDLLGKSGRVDEAWKFFEELKLQNIRPDQYTYNTIIVRMAKVGKLEVCTELIKEMEGRGITMDRATFCNLIEMLSRVGHIEKACGYLKDMKTAGHVPQVNTLQTVINHAKRLNKTDVVNRLMPQLEHAEMEHYRICPSY